MRNGNALSCSFAFASLLSSYRTYEEWKHTKSWHKASFLFVLTVPMRNGNVSEFVNQDLEALSSYRTYEEWKLYSNDTFAP